MYKNFVKPVLDRLLALIFVLLFWWLYIIVAILVKVKLRSPVLFVQERLGKIDEIKAICDEHGAILIEVCGGIFQSYL